MTWSTMSSRRIRISSAGRCSASRAQAGRQGRGRALEVDGGLTVKLTDEAAREVALAIDGVELFDPGMGRVMREWVSRPRRRTPVGASSSSARSRWTTRASATTTDSRRAHDLARGRQTQRHLRHAVLPKKSGRVIAGLTRSGEGMVFKLADEQAHARALAPRGRISSIPAAVRRCSGNGSSSRRSRQTSGIACRRRLARWSRSPLGEP